MATRLYLCNQTAPYIPATIRGAWDQVTTPITGLLSPGVSGTSTTKGNAEINASPTFDVLIGRFISQPLQSDVSFATTDTFQSIIGWLESNLAADDVPHVHVFVTTGDSDTVRGILVADALGAPLSTEELPTTAAGQLFNNNVAIALSNNVSAKAGDRIVLEIGYQAQNSVTTSRTATINYGGTGADLTDADTAVTTHVGWLEFSKNFGVGLGATNDSLGSAYT